MSKASDYHRTHILSGTFTARVQAARALIRRLSGRYGRDIDLEAEHAAIDAGTSDMSRMDRADIRFLWALVLSGIYRPEAEESPAHVYCHSCGLETSALMSEGEVTRLLPCRVCGMMTTYERVAPL